MNIRKEKKTEDSLLITLDGRLDITTAPDLEAELKQDLPGLKNLVFDFANLEYVSSAGLRVILSAQKVMNRQGSMVIRNTREEVLEVFEVTGFIDIFTLE